MLLAPANVARNAEINQTDIELNSISSGILKRLVHLIYEILGDIYTARSSDEYSPEAASSERTLRWKYNCARQHNKIRRENVAHFDLWNIQMNERQMDVLSDVGFE